MPATITPDTPSDERQLNPAASSPPSTDADVSRAVADEIVRLSESPISPLTPQGIAHALAAYLEAHYPKSVALAYWITIAKPRLQDKGIFVEIARLPWHLQVRAMLGGWSAGFGVQTPSFNVEQFHAKVSVGVGAVTSYAQLGKLIPVVSFSVSL